MRFSIIQDYAKYKGQPFRRKPVHPERESSAIVNLHTVRIPTSVGMEHSFNQLLRSHRLFLRFTLVLLAEAHQFREFVDARQVVRLGEAVIGQANPRFLILAREFFRHRGDYPARHAPVRHDGNDPGELRVLEPFDAAADG